MLQGHPDEATGEATTWEDDSGFEQWLEHQRLAGEADSTEVDLEQEEDAEGEETENTQGQRKRTLEQGCGSSTEPMPSVGGATVATSLPGQAWEANGGDAQMLEDAVQPVSNSAKRVATAPPEDESSDISLKNLMNMMNNRFSRVLDGQQAQVQNMTEIRQQVNLLRDQTQRSFSSIVSRGSPRGRWRRRRRRAEDAGAYRRVGAELATGHVDPRPSSSAGASASGSTRTGSP